MTLLVEKSLWKSPSITDAIKLFALEEILIEKKIKKLSLVSENKKLHKTLESLCQNLKIDYFWIQQKKTNPKSLNLRGLYRQLPHIIQASIYFMRYLYVRWPLRKVKREWFDRNSAFFCSYFFQLDSTLARDGRFKSAYWGSLDQLLNKLNIKRNWLQIYLPNQVAPNASVAAQVLQNFNAKRERNESHSFLETYLSFSLILKSSILWMKLFLISLKLNKIKLAFQPTQSNFSLWEFMKNDWHTSLRGIVACDNIIWTMLFDKALKEIPAQKVGFYLCENQAWERALIHYWKKHNHKKIIGVAHATVRFWDLRYFTDERTLNKIPKPDLMALNGTNAWNAYSEAKYPTQLMVECEALRYINLKNLVQRSSTQKNKILILGDYLESSTQKMLKLLEEAISQTSQSFELTFKPHPNLLIKAEDYPTLNLTITMDPLEKIMANFNIAYASNFTSAAVDAYLAGLSVIVMLDETELNCSPLRGKSNVYFVSSPQELLDAFKKENISHETPINQNNFFFLGQQLPRWEKLLSKLTSDVEDYSS